jgi:hypothetical protein
VEELQRAAELRKAKSTAEAAPPDLGEVATEHADTNVDVAMEAS